jgi:exonuclease III
MRLIAWNCKGAFHRKESLVRALEPDVLVVPECEQPRTIQRSFDSSPVRSFEWFGKNPAKGIAAVSYGKYSLKVHADYEPRHEWIVPLVVSGPMTFVLFAVWTIPLGSQGGRYVRPLFEALESYEHLIRDTPSVWAGDFNANVIWDTPRRPYKFREFADRLAAHDIRSIYHEERGCEHGKETDPTFYLHHRVNRPYHLDFVFASRRLRPGGVRISIGSHEEWAKHSDHTPLICDFARRTPSRHAVVRTRSLGR